MCVLKTSNFGMKVVRKACSRAPSKIYNSEVEPNNLHTSLPGKFENHWYQTGGKKMRLRSEAMDRVRHTRSKESVF